MGLADGRPPFAQLFWKEGAAAAAAVAAAAGAEGAAEGAADADVGRAHEAGGGGGDNSSDMEGGVPRPLLRSSTHVLAELLCSGYDPTCGILPAAPSVCVTNALVCALCAAEGDACFEGGGTGGGALTVASGKFVFDDAAKGENVCLLCHVPSSRRKLIDLASDAGEACSHAVCLCCMPASVCALEPGVDAPPCPLCATVSEDAARRGAHNGMVHVISFTIVPIELCNSPPHCSYRPRHRRTSHSNDHSSATRTC